MFKILKQKSWNGGGGVSCFDAKQVVATQPQGAFVNQPQDVCVFSKKKKRILDMSVSDNQTSVKQFHWLFFKNNALAKAFVPSDWRSQ